MGDKSKIEWTDATWNPVTGCTKVSQGCKNCYAERLFHRPYPGRAFTDVRIHPDRLDQPLRWRKPRMIFVNSMSDLFHEAIPDEFIAFVFASMSLAKQHKFQVLTKRQERMRELLNSNKFLLMIVMAMCELRPNHDGGSGWPLPNVWLGVSVENQETADERIPLLLETPAAVRWLSCEPLLGPVDLERIRWPNEDIRLSALRGGRKTNTPWHVNWVVVGGESGARARPMEESWCQDIRRQCAAADVPFFFKQGSQANWRRFKEFASFPPTLRVREYPNEP